MLGKEANLAATQRARRGAPITRDGRTFVEQSKKHDLDIVGHAPPHSLRLCEDKVIAMMSTAYFFPLRVRSVVVGVHCIHDAVEVSPTACRLSRLASHVRCLLARSVRLLACLLASIDSLNRLVATRSNPSLVSEPRSSS